MLNLDPESYKLFISVNNGDEQLYKTKLPAIDSKKKPTQMHGYVDNLMKLFEEESLLRNKNVITRSLCCFIYYMSEECFTMSK